MWSICGGVGQNFRPFESRLVSAWERVWFERLITVQRVLLLTVDSGVGSRWLGSVSTGAWFVIRGGTTVLVLVSLRLRVSTLFLKRRLGCFLSADWVVLGSRGVSTFK